MEKAIRVIIVALFIFLLGFLIAFFTAWLWNALVPSIFGLREINAWEAWGLMVLSSVFFRGTITLNAGKS